MSKPAAPVRAQLEAWRARRADRLDPVRFHHIDALERRASRQAGEVRRLLDDRLASMVEAYARGLEEAAARTNGSDAPVEPGAPSRGALGALGELADLLARQAAARDGEAPAAEATRDASAPPALATLDEFQQIWSQVRVQSQVRQSLKQAPTGAGPLNSSALVHRSIALMRELSPGYLQHFLAYVDDLAWAEQLGAAGMVTAREAPQAAGARKRSRGKASAT